MCPTGILFLQETCFSIETEKELIDDFNDKIYYSHDKTSSCVVLITICGNLNISVKHKVDDNDGRVLILEVTIDDSDYLLISLYIANTERQRGTVKNNKKTNNLLKNFEKFHLLFSQVI